MSNLPPREPPDLRNRGQQQYPPQQPGGQYPPQQYPPSYPPPGTGPLSPQNPLGPVSVPKRLNKEQNEEIHRDFHERRIEYLAWGSVVLIVGFSIILLAIDTDTAKNFLLIGAPVLGGMILMFSGFVQRIIFNYKVSIVTWGTAIVGLAFGITQLIATLTEREGNEYFVTQLLIFIGLLVIISGMVIILQVFRRPQGD